MRGPGTSRVPGPLRSLALPRDRRCEDAGDADPRNPAGGAAHDRPEGHDARLRRVDRLGDLALLVRRARGDEDARALDPDTHATHSLVVARDLDVHLRVAAGVELLR